jgi:hypothetical protein
MVAVAFSNYTALLDRELSSHRESTSLRALEEIVRDIHSRRSENTACFAISDRDILREVLLNCGGLSNLTAETSTLDSACSTAIEHLIERRRPHQRELFRERVISRLRSTRISQVDDETAAAVFEGFHYLGTSRRDSLNLGLFIGGDTSHISSLLGVVSISKFDLFRLVPKVVGLHESQSAAVLSRIALLPTKCKNVVSRLIGASCAWLSEHRSDISCLYTYNNPNLGFHGTVYRATNWQLIARESKLADYAVDGHYVPRRELARISGGVGDMDFLTFFGSRISRLPASQLPLELYRLKIGKRK